MQTSLYDHNTIDSLPWPQGEDGDYARRFLVPLIKNGIRHYIDNIDVQLMALMHRNVVIPITVIDEKYGISHVCSPYDHYISHALESMHFIKNRFLNRLAKGGAQSLGGLLRLARFNKVINVNNWLFATDLYPKELCGKAIEEIASYLAGRFPYHAIVFRSINSSTHSPVLQELRKQQASLIASRQVYLSDTTNESIFKTRIFKSDLRLLRDSKYEIVDGRQLSRDEFPAIIDLYKKLYVDKHSSLNPLINENFIALLIDQNLLQIKVLKNKGIIDGVVGYFSRNNVATSPFFGYDQQKSQHSELYRLLSTILMLQVKEKGMILHQGAGASFYKKLRRAESHLEYMAVYSDHLSFRQKMGWQLIKQVMNHLAIPLMKKY